MNENDAVKSTDPFPAYLMPKSKKQFLKLNIDGKRLEASRENYVTAKTKQLREFGYAKLTEAEVNAQITAIIDDTERDVIGKFMEGEVLGVA